MTGSDLPPEDAAGLRSAGDRLRDEKRWHEAAARYAEYLQQFDSDWPIWVQHGHCLKEQGQIEAGLASYRRALEHAPNDSDLHLQIGHALKLLGNMTEALHAYRQSLALDHDNADAKEELLNLEAAFVLEESRRLAPTAARSTRLVFDISDLIQYMREWRVPSGIQRVQLNIIYFALTDFAELAKPLIMCFDQARGTWVHIDQEFFFKLHSAALSGDALLEEDLTELLEKLNDEALPPDLLDDQMRSDDFILVNLGTSWWVENYFLKVRALRRNYGIRYVPMIHDVIPLVAPEHCAQRLVEEFCQWFSTLAFEVDGAVTNSNWSAIDIQHYVSELMPEADFPIEPIALNGDMRNDLSSRTIPAKDLIKHIVPPGVSFVLCVGTLESRKNHLLLFKAWECLLQRHGSTEVPLLVCLGKVGWLFDEAAEFLRSRVELSHKVLLISSVTDQLLAALYQESLFTVFNSFYEGWGLPVTESLSFGALPLIPCNTALTEAGGRAALYFRSSDLVDLSDKLERLIFRHDERRRLRGQAQANARLRDWKLIAGEFITKLLATEPSASARQAALLRVPIGHIIHLGKSNALEPSIELAMANLLRDGLNWHRLEDWGSWTTPGIAEIRLPLPAGVIDKELMLFLRLRGTAVDTQIRVACRLGEQQLGAPVEMLMGHGRRHNLIFKMRPMACDLSILIDTGAGSSLGPGDREVGIGVTHLMLCFGDDWTTQDRFMNSFPEFRQHVGNGAHITLHRIEVSDVVSQG